MKLGEKVKFRKEVKKLNTYFNPDDISDDELNHEGLYSVEKIKVVELKEELQGIVVGKRKMSKTAYYKLEYGNDFDPYDDISHSYFEKRDLIDVFIIATNLNRFFRVVPNDLVKVD